MGKKKRTKKQKIIASLKRQLAQQQKIAETYVQLKEVDKELPLLKKEKKPKKEKGPKKPNLAFSYDPELIKKDLLKTLILSLVFLGLIILSWWLIEVKNILPF